MIDPHHYYSEALEAVSEHMGILPTETQEKVRQALVVIRNRGLVSCEYLNAEIGGRNWVIARRTRNIIERYGEDVITLTPQQFHEAETRAIARQATTL